MAKKTLLLLLIAGIGFYAPQQVEACGGQTASLGSVDSKLVAWTHADGNPRAMDYRANVQPKEVFIPPALADAIAEKYVAQYYPNAESVDFHAFLYEHGDYVYMYDITDSSIRNTSSVTACGFNPQKSESNSEDIHINAATGDIWDGQGCGGGPSKIVKRYNPSDYPAELAAQTKKLNQFHSDFVIPVAGGTVAPKDHENNHTDGHSQIVSSELINIDGQIDESEWSDAAYTQLKQYGKTINIRAKIVEGVMYWAIEVDSKNWLALLLKTSPHHGMVWEFTDAKMLSQNGVEDYHVAYKGMMRGAGLEKDRSSAILAQAASETERGRTYEFSMPLQSGAEGVDFQIGEYGNMAFYFGSSETLSGKLVYDDAFSKQMVAHIGEEIHRGVMSKIIPTAIAAEFGYNESRGDTTIQPTKGNISIYLLIIAITAVFIVAFRKKLGLIVKK